VGHDPEREIEGSRLLTAGVDVAPAAPQQATTPAPDDGRVDATRGERLATDRAGRDHRGIHRERRDHAGGDARQQPSP
jgi:hypothetical protein